MSAPSDPLARESAERLESPDSLASKAPAPNDKPEEKSLLEVTLDGAIALAKESQNYNSATQQFEALAAQIEADSPPAATLLKQLWAEYLSAQRSALFWKGMSDAERGLSEKMVQGNLQLKQNYMRLIQEQ